MHVHDFLNQIKKATRELTDKNGKLPTDEELSLHLQVAVVKIQVRGNPIKAFCLGVSRVQQARGRVLSRYSMGNKFVRIFLVL